jgi:hypothetical protein
MHHETDIEWLLRECKNADSFAELVPIAIDELKKFADGAEVVCGPITTGGRGSIEANLAVFNGSIRALQQEGRPVFNQVPYEERFFFFKKRWLAADPTRAGQYYMPILEEFYLPIFQTGLIKRGWFIPGWESSFGTRWERKTLPEHGAEIHDLTTDWIDRILHRS